MKIDNKGIAVLGDLILDKYVFGSVERISPEAPVPILSQTYHTYVLGGALNVANNIQSLGKKTYVMGVIGEDSEGQIVLDLLNDKKINIQNILMDKNFITSLKTRFASNHHHLLRVDREKIVKSNELDEFFFESFRKISNRINILIVSDYGKGVCSENLLKKLIIFANEKNIRVFVDPKGDNYNKYGGSFCITPNLNEAKFVLKEKLNTNLAIKNASKKISEKFKIKNCIITMGEQGSMTYSAITSKFYRESTSKVEVFDVSGAGDMFIAALASKYDNVSEDSLKKSLKFAHKLATKSVKYFGTTSIGMINK